MVTRDESSRLSVLEEKVSKIEHDVTEIKGDVKQLLRSDAMLSLMRWAIPGAALVASLYAVFVK